MTTPNDTPMSPSDALESIVEGLEQCFAGRGSNQTYPVERQTIDILIRDWRKGRDRLHEMEGLLQEAKLFLVSQTRDAWADSIAERINTLLAQPAESGGKHGSTWTSEIFDQISAMSDLPAPPEPDEEALAKDLIDSFPNAAKQYWSAVQYDLIFRLTTAALRAARASGMERAATWLEEQAEKHRDKYSANPSSINAPFYNYAADEFERAVFWLREAAR